MGTTDSVFYCELALMNIGTRSTQFGPMFIIGMPWFRKYYTTFNLGSGTASSRYIHVTEADRHCDPKAASFATKRVQESHQVMRPPVDFSKAWVPHWLGDSKEVQL